MAWLLAQAEGAVARQPYKGLGERNPQQLWAEAQRRCRLSDEGVQIARDLGLNPRSLIKNIPSPSEPWKEPVEDWVRAMAARRGGAAARRASRDPGEHR